MDRSSAATARAAWGTRAWPGTPSTRAGGSTGRWRCGRGSGGAQAERRKASIRAKVEHPFWYVKRHFGYTQVRYRGLAKNRTRLCLLLGFANLLLAERAAPA